MKILEVTKDVAFIVETDEAMYPTYRRSLGGSWENLIGDSWEPVYMQEAELEAAYQDWLNKTK
jgi:hypothetical protein